MAAASSATTVTVEARVDQLEDLVVDLNDAVAGRGIAISMDHFVIKAFAMALAAHLPSMSGETSGAPAPTPSLAVASSAYPRRTVIRRAGESSLSAIATQLTDDATSTSSANSEGDHPLVSIAALDHMIGTEAASLTLTIGPVRRRAREIGGALTFVSVLTATATFRDPSTKTDDAVSFLESFRALLESPFDLTV